MNTYGNVSANYTWDENQSFAKYNPFWNIDACVLRGFASGNATCPSGNYDYFENLNNAFNPILGNATDTNSTSYGDSNNIPVPKEESGWLDVILLSLVVILVVCIII